MSIKLVSLVAVFGALGVLLRFVTVHLTARHFPDFPMGTFIVNIVGSFLIGCIFACFAARTDLPQAWRIVLVSGFLGGFTTFSSFSWELFEFYRDGNYLSVAIYGIGSPVAGLLSAGLGALAAARFIG